MENQKQAHDIEFDMFYCEQLLEQNKLEDVKSYIKKFFFKYKQDIFYFDGEKFELHNKADALGLISKNLEKYQTIDKKSVQVFSGRGFLQTTEFMKYEYTPTIDFTKPRTFEQIKVIDGVNITKRHLNMAKPFAIDRSKKVDVKKYESDLKLIYDHILNIWCSKNDELYEYVLNWIACTFGGRKLRKCIYSQCEERCGRGCIINFLQSIFGDAMLKTSSAETVSKYTKPFEGTLLVNLDEMPVDGSNFKSIADNMKMLITEPTFDCRDMYKTGYTQKNTFNLIVTTNNDAIHMSLNNNTRYVCLDIDESMKSNVPYFTKLTKAIKKEEVKTAFYMEMMARFETLNDWNEDIIPMSKTKQSKMIDALPSLYKFLKEYYILKSKSLDIRTDDFFELYEYETKDRTSKQKLGKLLKKINIVPIKVKKGNVQCYHYRKTHDELLEEFNKNSWIDDENDK